MENTLDDVKLNEAIVSLEKDLSKFVDNTKTFEEKMESFAKAYKESIQGINDFFKFLGWPSKLTKQKKLQAKQFARERNITYGYARFLIANEDCLDIEAELLNCPNRMSSFLKHRKYKRNHNRLFSTRKYAKKRRHNSF